MPIEVGNYNPAWQSQWRQMQSGIDRSLASAPATVVSRGRRAPEQIYQNAQAIASQAKQGDQSRRELEEAKRLIGVMGQLRNFATTPEATQNLMKLAEHLNGVISKYEGATRQAAGAGATPHYPTAGTPGNPPQYAIPEGGIPLPGGLSRSSGMYAERKPDGGYKITNVGKVRTDRQGIPGAGGMMQQIIGNAATALNEKAAKEGAPTQKDILEQASKAYAEVVKITPMNQQPQPWGEFYKGFVDAVQGGAGTGGQQAASPTQGQNAERTPVRQPAPTNSPMMWVTDTEGRRILVPRMEEFDWTGEPAAEPGIPAKKTGATKKDTKKPTVKPGEVRYGKARGSDVDRSIALGGIPERPVMPSSRASGPSRPLYDEPAATPEMVREMMGRDYSDQAPGYVPPTPTPYQAAYPAEGRGIQGAANMIQGMHEGLTGFQQNLRNAYGQNMMMPAGQAPPTPSPMPMPADAAPPMPVPYQNKVRMPIPARPDPWSSNGPQVDPWSPNGGQPQIVRRGTDRATGRPVVQLSTGEIIEDPWAGR